MLRLKPSDLKPSKRRNPGRKEAEVKREIMRALKLAGIFAIRINSGAVFGETHGRKWAVRSAEPGTADILALPAVGLTLRCTVVPVWIECKRPGGKQSQAQRDFENAVTSRGHAYGIATNAEEALAICRDVTMTDSS